jgi:hypothetical protein
MVATLRACAAAQRTITYSALRDRLDFHGDLVPLLRAVSVEEDRAGRGLLSALVVTDEGRPGAGWFRLAAEHGRDAEDPERCWRRERDRLFEMWGDDA